MASRLGLALMVIAIWLWCGYGVVIAVVEGDPMKTWIMETDKLPTENRTGKTLVDFRKMAAIGNGHVATVLYSDVIYMNGLYNGPVGWTHRAAIRSVHDVVVNVEGQMVNRKYALNVWTAVFTETISSPGLEIKVMTYAHQRLVQLIVTEVHAQRTDGKREEFRLMMDRSHFDSTEDLKMQQPTSAYTTGCRYADECMQSYGRTNITETDFAAIGEVYAYWTEVPRVLNVSSGDTERKWIFFSSFDKDQRKASNSFQTALTLRGDTPERLRKTHDSAWADKWNSGRIDVQGDDDLATVIHAGLYYILMSLPSTHPEQPPEQFYGLSPGSLARGANWTDYQGHVFWDMETWMFPPILALFPDLARAMLSYRVFGGAGARAKALEHGMEGWQFPWESAFTGYEMTPLVCVPCRDYEQHITADVAFAARQYWASTRDVTWLTGEGGLDLLVNTADFWTSRAEYNEEHDRYEINGVMPPDEFAEHVNNSVYTNYGAKVNIQMADYVSCLAGKLTSPQQSQHRQEVAEKLYILFNETTRHHPEYEGYDHNETAWKNTQLVKQADVVMLGYPLGMQMDTEVRQNDLNLYEERSDVNGPAMTWSMYAINWLDLGDVEKAADMFSKSYTKYTRMPFNTWTEVTSGMGATNFITGIGGFLQAVIFGYGGLRIELEHLKFHPRLPPAATRLTFTGLDYLGATFDLMVTSDQVLLVVRATDEAFPLQLTSQTGTTWILRSGMELKLKQEPFTISSLSVPECPMPEGSSCPAVFHDNLASVAMAALPGHVDRVLVSQSSGGPRCSDFLTCSSAVAQQKAGDDSINFYIGGDGRIYQGSPITSSPEVLRVMFLGDYTLQGMTQEQEASVRKLIKCGQESQARSIALDYRLQFEVQAPEECGTPPCAGNSLHCQLMTWKRWVPGQNAVQPDCSSLHSTNLTTTSLPTRSPASTPNATVPDCPPAKPVEVTCNCQVPTGGRQASRGSPRVASLDNALLTAMCFSCFFGFFHWNYFTFSS